MRTVIVHILFELSRFGKKLKIVRPLAARVITMFRIPTQVIYTGDSFQPRIHGQCSWGILYKHESQTYDYDHANGRKPTHTRLRHSFTELGPVCAGVDSRGRRKSILKCAHPTFIACIINNTTRTRIRNRRRRSFVCRLTHVRVSWGNLFRPLAYCCNNTLRVSCIGIAYIAVCEKTSRALPATSCCSCSRPEICVSASGKTRWTFYRQRRTRTRGCVFSTRFFLFLFPVRK